MCLIKSYRNGLARLYAQSTIWPPALDSHRSQRKSLKMRWENLWKSSLLIKQLSHETKTSKFMSPSQDFMNYLWSNLRNLWEAPCYFIVSWSLTWILLKLRFVWDSFKANDALQMIQVLWRLRYLCHLEGLWYLVNSFRFEYLVLTFCAFESREPKP